MVMEELSIRPRGLPLRPLGRAPIRRRRAGGGERSQQEEKPASGTHGRSPSGQLLDGLDDLLLLDEPALATDSALGVGQLEDDRSDGVVRLMLTPSEMARRSRRRW